MSTISKRQGKKNLIYYNLKGTNWAHPTHLRRAVGCRTISFVFFFYSHLLLVVVALLFLCFPVFVHRRILFRYTRKMIQRFNFFFHFDSHCTALMVHFFTSMEEMKKKSLKRSRTAIAPYFLFGSLFIIYYFILSIFKWVAHFCTNRSGRVRGWTNIRRFLRFLCISFGRRRMPCDKHRMPWAMNISNNMLDTISSEFCYLL